METQEETKPRTYRGMSKVSNYQRMLIQTVIEKGSRSAASEYLGINPRTMEDAIYRAFRALKVGNISDAHYLISQGVMRRDEPDVRRPKDGGQS